MHVRRSHPPTSRPLVPALLGVAFALAVVACGESRPAASPKTVVLISIDTLRADRLGAYGHDQPTSPNLDAFAAQGVLFEDASSTSPWTLPAHVSLLSGRTPRGHGVRTAHRQTPTDLPTLATILAEQGYETAAIVNSAYIADDGLRRGFGFFRNVKPDHGPLGAGRRIVDAAVAWLANRRAGPAFLFLHFYDVHSDYRSRPEIESMFVRRRSPEDGSSLQLMGLFAKAPPVPAETADYLARLYDAGIRQLDGEMGRLFGALEKMGLERDALVVITSDHGEEFGDHGFVSHGQSHYRETLQVPLIFRGPGVPAGMRVAAPVSLTDVVPTILDLVGVAPPAGVEGHSLRPAWEQPGAYAARPVFAETGPGTDADLLASVREGPFKLIVNEETGERELYDLASDPGETRNLAGERPEIEERLAARLAAHRSRRGREAPQQILDSERREQLRALGYVVGDEAPLGEAAP